MSLEANTEKFETQLRSTSTSLRQDHAREAVPEEVTPSESERGTERTTAASVRNRFLPDVFVVAIYFGIAVFAYSHAWVGGLSSHAISNTGDDAASMWFITWLPFSILHGHNPLFSNFGNFPYGINMLVNTSTLPLGLLVTPLTLLFGPVVSYNVLQTAAFAASAWAAYFLARRFTSWRPAAFVGGLLYGFSPYLVAQNLGHLMVAFVPLPPLILLLVHDVITRQRGRPVRVGVLLGLLAVVQFFISSELLFDTVLMAVAGVAVAAVCAPAKVIDHFRYAVLALGSAVATCVVLLSYPLWFLLAGPAHVVGPIQPYTQAYRADLFGPLVPDSLMHFAPSSLAEVARHFAGGLVENGSYLGLPLILLVVTGTVALWRMPIVRISGILCAFAFVLSLGSRLVVDNHPTAIPMPEAMIAKVPILNNVLPVRLSLFVFLFSSVIVTVSLDVLRVNLRSHRTRHLARIWPAFVPLALSTVALLPLTPAWPYPMEATTLPPYFSSGAVEAIPQGSVAALYPFPNHTLAVAQVWQASEFLRFKIPGGYFNVPSPTTGTIRSSRPSLVNTVLTQLAAGRPPARTADLRARMRAEMRSWQVHTFVAVPPLAQERRAVSFLSWVLGRPPVESKGAFVWYHLR